MSEYNGTERRTTTTVSLAKIEKMYEMIEGISNKVDIVYVVLKGDDKNREDFGLEGDIKDMGIEVGKNTALRHSITKTISITVKTAIVTFIAGIVGGLVTKLKGIW